MHRRADRTRVLRQWFHDPCAPDQFTHHALVAGADVRIIPALERDLRLRLYSGNAGRTGAIRSGTFRQGAAGKWAAWLCSTGCIGLIAIGLAASPLGRDSRQHARQGGVVRAALPAPDFEALHRPAVIFVCAAVLATGVLGRCQPAQARLAGRTSSRGRPRRRLDRRQRVARSGSVRREFASFVRRATHLARSFEAAGNGTHHAAIGRGNRRHRSAQRARTFLRGAGSVARTWAGSAARSPLIGPFRERQRALHRAVRITVTQRRQTQFGRPRPNRRKARGQFPRHGCHVTRAGRRPGPRRFIPLRATTTPSGLRMTASRPPA